MTDRQLNTSDRGVTPTAETIARIAEFRFKLLNVEKCDEISTPKTWMTLERLKDATMNAEADEAMKRMLETVQRKPYMQRPTYTLFSTMETTRQTLA